MRMEGHYEKHGDIEEWVWDEEPKATETAVEEETLKPRRAAKKAADK